MKIFDAERDTMQMRDEIVARNPALLPRTLAVQRAWEQELTENLARRRDLGAGDATAQVDAAVVLVVVRLAFRRPAGRCLREHDGRRRRRDGRSVDPGDQLLRRAVERWSGGAG